MDKIKNQILNKYRNCLIGIITNNMGKVKETEDNFICYVDNKIFRDKNFVIMNNLDNLDEKHISKIKKYNLDKPVIYVFDGINLNDNIHFSIDGSNCTIIIRNSIFNGFRISNYQGTCYLSNVIITSNEKTSYMGLSVKNLYINNLTVAKLENCFEISFYASKKIKINELNVLDNPSVFISIYCPEKIAISSSIINSKKLSIKSNVINFEQNMYVNQRKDLNDTNIDLLTKENKKLTKVKFR